MNIRAKAGPFLEKRGVKEASEAMLIVQNIQPFRASSGGPTHGQLRHSLRRFPFLNSITCRLQFPSCDEAGA